VPGFPYLYPPGTGWLGYNPKHWVSFSSPPTTRRVTVEVFEPSSTRELTGSPQLSRRKILGRDHIENTLVSSAVVQLLKLNNNGLHNTVSNCNSILVQACLPLRCIAMAVVSLFVSRSLPSNGSIRNSTKKKRIRAELSLYVSMKP
jgi:hypothetical protein